MVNDFIKKIQGVAKFLVDVVLPPRCVISGEIVDRQGMISPKIWTDLEFISDPLCTSCGLPFAFEVDKGALCASCLEDRPEYEAARSALVYNEASRKLLLGFKHADQIHAVLAFMPWMKSAGAEILQDADLIVPVPLHRWRLFRRRYNQSAVIAHALSQHTGLRVCSQGLIRHRSTPPQGHLSAKDRYKNVRSAFCVNPKFINNLKGKTVVLVDDVYTTGATVRECTKVLLKAGVAKVYVLCVARVVKGENF